MSSPRKHTRWVQKRIDKSGSERGAVFIEFALAVPFLVMMGLGIVEAGMAWKASTDVNSVARNAARSATSAPAYQAADRTVLGTVGAELSTEQLDQLQMVVVFKASAGQTKPPIGCLAAISPTSMTKKGIGSVCNVYSRDQVKAVVNGTASSSNFAGTSSCGASSWDSNWCPVNRNRAISSNSLDYLGVYVEIQNQSMTGASFGNMKVAKSAVFRLEPAFGAT